MKIPKHLGFVASCLGFALARGAAFAADTDKLVGTWELNASKSQGMGSTPDKLTVVVTDAGDGKLKWVSDTTMAGRQFHAELTSAVDGTYYTVSTPPPPPGAPAVTQTFERVNANVSKGELKLDGQTIATLTREVSADGKTLKMTTQLVRAASGVTSTADGKPLTMTAQSVGATSSGTSTVVFDRK